MKNIFVYFILYLAYIFSILIFFFQRFYENLLNILNNHILSRNYNKIFQFDADVYHFICSLFELFTELYKTLAKAFQKMELIMAMVAIFSNILRTMALCHTIPVVLIFHDEFCEHLLTFMKLNDKRC